MRFPVFLAILLTADASWAQQPAPSPPPEPLIAAHMPASSSWTAMFVYGGAEKDEVALSARYAAAIKQRAANDAVLARELAANPAMLVRPSNIKQRIITKTGDVREEMTIYTSGQHGERWQFGNKVVTHDAYTHRFSMETSGPVKNEADFPEFAWISKQNFTGIQTIEGKKCLVFTATVDPERIENPRLFAQTSGNSDPNAKMPATAIIDLDTRLPVSVQCGSRVQTYQVLAAPTEGLVVPPEFLAVAQEAEKRINMRNAPLSAP